RSTRIPRFLRSFGWRSECILHGRTQSWLETDLTHSKWLLFALILASVVSRLTRS
ncbi:hypothetical protein D030_0455B, partial [Vibrio parahaemolyticus AQ3810]